MKTVSDRVLKFIGNNKVDAYYRYEKLKKEALKFEESQSSLTKEEEHNLRVRFKEGFLGVFKSQNDWKEILNDDGHFIYSPFRMEIFDLNKVFLDTSVEFSIYYWLEHVCSIIWNEQRNTEIEEGFRMAFTNDLRQEISKCAGHLDNSLLLHESDFEQFQQVMSGNYCEYDNSGVENEFEALMAQIDVHLNINPYPIIHFDNEKLHQGELIVEINNMNIDILDLYRLMRDHNRFVQAVALTINALYAIVYTEYVTDSPLLTKIM